MKKLMNLMLIFGVLIILSSCGDSKVINIGDLSPATISVTIKVDTDSYSDMLATPRVYLTLKENDPTIYPKAIPLNSTWLLTKGKTYVLGGGYTNTSNVYMTFPDTVFMADIYEDTYRSITVTRTATHLITTINN